jgi:hypothetical protein
MRQILLVGLTLGLAACSEGTQPDRVTAVETPELVTDPCVRSGYDRSTLNALKAKNFEIADEAERQKLAMAMTECLASPDPSLRDGIAYEALTHLLREKQLTPETMKSLATDLVARLEAPEGEGYERPFAALALSEVARADREEAFLGDDELKQLLAKAISWFRDISDYRGFDDREGWRHGVAHGSDLLMQLALNPRIEADDLRKIVTAVQSQIAPKGVSYTDGESERLARPVLFAASRGAMNEAQWTSWLKSVATPVNADKVFKSEEGLAWRHNTMAFLQSLYVNVTLGGEKADDVMLPGLESALKAMP